MGMKRKTWIGLVVVAVLVVAGGSALAFRKPKNEVKWRTAQVERGNITQRISATGTINALVQVPVGTQVSGVVTDLYADYNSLVTKGQVIARIDPTPWETQLEDAKATVQRAQASYENAKADYNRNKRLAEQQLLSTSDLESKELALKTALGNLVSAKASFQKAQLNLGYCTIHAPVDGVVISRAVDVGQTVAASFSTPNLFTIAKDLSRMTVVASIDEADIGLVSVGQRAFFTVDSFPDRQFKGSVSEVRLEPIINQNVVTYNVVMEVSNEAKVAAPAEGGPRAAEPRTGGRPTHWEGRPPTERLHRGEAQHQRPSRESTEDRPTTARYVPAGGRIYRGEMALMPGMTANVSIVTAWREATLRVPSVALRFNPRAFLKTEPVKADASRTSSTPQKGTAPRGAGSKSMVTKREDRIWILENGTPKALTVKTGASDGQFTEISGEGVQEGMQILTGVEDFKKADTPVASPLGASPGGLPRR